VEELQEELRMQKQQEVAPDQVAKIGKDDLELSLSKIKQELAHLRENNDELTRAQAQLTEANQRQEESREQAMQSADRALSLAGDYFEALENLQTSGELKAESVEEARRNEAVRVGSRTGASTSSRSGFSFSTCSMTVDEPRSTSCVVKRKVILGTSSTSASPSGGVVDSATASFAGGPADVVNFSSERPVKVARVCPVNGGITSADRMLVKARTTPTAVTTNATSTAITSGSGNVSASSSVSSAVVVSRGDTQHSIGETT